ncbi:MAG: sulfopyruvate decarboxylase subunit beta [Dehalococcoidia bacterium]|nr:sulfopyruvate decarboxylase subunit beta [Dehalococcoidia bacterium]
MYSRCFDTKERCSSVIRRSDAIIKVMESVDEEDLVVSTTGMISRELFYNADRPANFYMLGSMGLASSLGLGLCLKNPMKKVFILEGDGSSLMSLGAIPLISACHPNNLIHVIFDNQCYESTGGQPSISVDVDISEIARASGYNVTCRITALEEIDHALYEYQNVDGPILLLIECNHESSHDVPRVSHTPVAIRDMFKGAFNQTY